LVFAERQMVKLIITILHLFIVNVQKWIASLCLMISLLLL